MNQHWSQYAYRHPLGVFHLVDVLVCSLRLSIGNKRISAQNARFAERCDGDPMTRLLRDKALKLKLLSILYTLVSVKEQHLLPTDCPHWQQGVKLSFW